MGILDRLIHARRFEFIAAEEINAEAGTMDFYCGCWLCRRLGRA